MFNFLYEYLREFEAYIVNALHVIQIRYSSLAREKKRVQFSRHCRDTVPVKSRITVPVQILVTLSLKKLATLAL